MAKASGSSKDRAVEQLAGATARLADLIEHQFLPRLDRLIAALEAGPRPAQTPPPQPQPATGEERVSPYDAIRLALRHRRWQEAEAILAEHLDSSPDETPPEELVEEIRAQREAGIADLRAQLDASRQVNDTETVLALHEELSRVLHAGERKELDDVVVRWSLAQIQRRMRGGTVGVDVVQLATVVAERFAARPEGASLRASLPVLRRSAGLCGRCGEPYDGLDLSCPKCQAADLARLAATAPPAAVDEEPADEPESESDA